MNFTVTAALAILLLGEMLTAAKAVALGCALVAVWLLLADAGAERGNSDDTSAEKSGDKSGDKSSGTPSLTSLSRVLIATAAMALTNFFYKVGLQDGALPETMVAAQA